MKIETVTGWSLPPMLQPLSSPTFRVIWFGSLLSNFGQLIQGVGAAWEMTCSKHGRTGSNGRFPAHDAALAAGRRTGGYV
jgi:hypothetical protein